ncbi:membrane-associated protein [Frigoribacterium sp. PhB160]|uniref:DedA family protein n=1 Tax=Frigoribacterium sp. PhB160 TaxID=2485192 RepID=UPI000F4A8B1F|nr:VTT domain-containing protein [Frigoribacterium sp. PhB160]ROS59511.1 membrane-associated protein [Frigoribacterium sp. PhB160]
MLPLATISWLDPEYLLSAFGPWAVLGVCLLVFAETGLLIGFLFPGDTLLIITGILAATNPGALGLPIWLIAIFIGIAAFAGGELGYLIGHKVGPRIFERRESGLFSKANVRRTNAFFEKFGPLAVIIARFVPVVRTFAPIMAGVGHMSYRRYSLYNGIGAIVWGFGVTMLGFGIGHIPPIADFVSEYIDLILLGAVLATVIPIAIHYFHGVHEAKQHEADGTTPDDEPVTPAVEPSPDQASTQA